jgi:hypothetical protein
MYEPPEVDDLNRLRVIALRQKLVETVERAAS